MRAFYVSNVEQYLFQDGKDGPFYDNVATLPVDSASVFIRPYSMRRGRRADAVAVPDRAIHCRVGAGRVRYNEEALACVK